MSSGSDEKRNLQEPWQPVPRPSPEANHPAGGPTLPRAERDAGLPTLDFAVKGVTADYLPFVDGVLCGRGLGPDGCGCGQSTGTVFG